MAFEVKAKKKITIIMLKVHQYTTWDTKWSIQAYILYQSFKLINMLHSASESHIVTLDID